MSLVKNDSFFGKNLDMENLIEKEYLYAGSKGTDSTDYCRQQHQYTDVTVTFAGGKEVRLPEKEFRYEKAADLKYLHGSIKEVRNEAEDETVVQGAVKREHDRRREMPRGYFAVHLQALDEQRIQAEADRLSAALTDLKQPNSPDKEQFYGGNLGVFPAPGFPARYEPAL